MRCSQSIQERSRRRRRASRRRRRAARARGAAARRTPISSRSTPKRRAELAAATCSWLSSPKPVDPVAGRRAPRHDERRAPRGSGACAATSRSRGGGTDGQPLHRANLITSCQGSAATCERGRPEAQEPVTDPVGARAPLSERYRRTSDSRLTALCQLRAGRPHASCPPAAAGLESSAPAAVHGNTWAEPRSPRRGSDRPSGNASGARGTPVCRLCAGFATDAPPRPGACGRTRPYGAEVPARP